jgi:hypothetical protein
VCLDVPELTMYAFFMRPPVPAMSSSARCSAISVPRVVERQYDTISSWRLIAALTRALLCPRQATAAPHVASRMVVPFDRVRKLPSEATTCRGLECTFRYSSELWTSGCSSLSASLREP